MLGFLFRTLAFVLHGLAVLIMSVIVGAVALAAGPAAFVVGVIVLVCIIGLTGLAFFLPYTIWTIFFGTAVEQANALHGLPNMLAVLAIFMIPFVLFGMIYQKIKGKKSLKRYMQDAWTPTQPLDAEPLQLTFRAKQ